MWQPENDRTSRRRSVGKVVASPSSARGVQPSAMGRSFGFSTSRPDVVDTLYGHTGEVTEIDASDDGRFIATGGREGLAYVWELDEGGARRVLTLPGHVGPLWKVQFSPDGRYLATISGSQEWPADVVVTWPRTWEVRLWDVSAAGSHEWTTVEARSSTVAFTADGTGVLGVDAESGVSIWDATTGAELQRLAAPEAGEEITATALSPDGHIIAIAGVAGGDEGWCAVESADTGELLHELMPPTTRVNPRDVVFSPDGDRDLPSPRVPSCASGTRPPGRWCSPSRIPAAPHLQRRVRERGVQSRREAAGHTGFLPRSANGRLRSGHRVGSRDTEQITGMYHFPASGFGHVAFSPDGRMLLTTGVARPIIYEPYTGRQLGVLDGPAANGVSAAFSPDGRRIATAEGDGTVRLWDATTAEEQLVSTATPTSGPPSHSVPTVRRLASVTGDGELRVWALDIDDLLSLARSRLTRELTDAECRAYIGEGCPPAPAIERLVPAQSEAAGPVGISVQAWAAAEPGGSWQQLEAPGPGGNPVLYDTRSDTLVAISLTGPSVFDGTSETWKQGTPAPPVPEAIATEVGNPEPSLGGAAYHPGLGSALVSRTDDGATLAYDVASDTWSVLASDGPFAFRYGEGMVYDTESEVMVSFGGAEWGRIEDGKHAGLDDTFIYDADQNAWIEQTPPVSPPGRVEHGIVYDKATDRIIVFGGSTGYGVGHVLGDTWAYDTNTDTWTEMNPTVSPPARAEVAMWYDPVADLVFLFGGAEDTNWPPLPWEMFGGEELWAYDYHANTWTLYRADPNPDYWLGGSVAFDVRTGVAVLIGGDWYNEDRQYQGSNTAVWTYRFR